MARAKVSKYYTTKNADNTFSERIYFGTYANFVTVRRPNQEENYEDLQTCLDTLDSKISNSIIWNKF